MKRFLRCVAATAFVFGFSTTSLISQDANIAQFEKHLLEKDSTLSRNDIQNLQITNEFQTKHNGITHAYFSQTLNGIRVMNSYYSTAFDENKNLKYATGKFYAGLQSNVTQPSVSLKSTILGLTSPFASDVEFESEKNNIYKIFIAGTEFSHKGRAELAYFMNPEKELKLVWVFDCKIPKTTHWFNYYVDAVSGEVVRREDWNLSCNLDDIRLQPTAAAPSYFNASSLEETSQDGSAYRVFPFPIESPNHGNRVLISEPADETASPFGWHDTDGLAGAEYTITRGNNVYAYEDIADMDEPGESPDGGEGLQFDFQYNPESAPQSYLDASITQLFFLNNRIHDILYNYGFDEQAGNFQDKNYTGLGEGDDYVLAECQDGGGFNNANMGTPPDGYNPVMQMYLWEISQLEDMFIVNTPSHLAGSYISSNLSAFSPSVPEGGITANLAVYHDDTGSNLACSPAASTDDLAGKIVLVTRGDCTFVEKVMAAQLAGAVACIIVNNVDGIIIPGGEDDDIVIPSFIITQVDGANLISEIESGEIVNATITGLVNDGLIDGSFDNGIVTHEYVHGLSTRLTGGNSSAWCLFNEEQMGEGWSDWYSVMFTMNMDVENPVYRPMGTFASSESTTGTGIRPAPYDTSFAVNPYTYADLGNAEITVPHGVGFIWSTMLWDLTWAFIEEYGYDEDIIYGNGGNNRVLKIVTDALKLQPCEPGFVDARDAILAADAINNDGANACLIWETFAKRGLGYSANQGSPDSRLDGVAGFDLPPVCLEITEAPIADFSAQNTESCHGIVEFTDLSENIPQSWYWEFGDGETSTEQNPTHIYTLAGVYSVSLTVQNTMGQNVMTKTDLVHLNLPDEVTDALGGSGCAGDTIVLSANSAQGEVVWFDESQNEVGTGSEIEVILGDETAWYYASSELEPVEFAYVGPEDEGIGDGEIHGNTFVGTVDFEAYQPLRIHSVYVYSGNTGIRIIKLWKGNQVSGELIKSIQIPINFTGGGRIELDIDIELPGQYSLGMSHANLFRNSSGVNYPYAIPELITINGSSGGPDYYYYFYDFEVTPKRCLSPAVEVEAQVVGSAQFTSIINELSVSFTGPEALSWEWDFGDGNQSFEQNLTHTYDELDIYNVTLTTESCQSSQLIDLNSTSILNAAKNNIRIFPNPAKDFIVIHHKENLGAKFASLKDIQGKVVVSTSLSGSSESWMPIGNVAEGIYVLELLDGNKTTLLQQKVAVVK